MAGLQQTADQLEGWGSFKKSVGLNKLGTRKAVKAVVATTKAVVAPSKKSVKNAAVKTGESKLASYVARVGANLVAPGSGEIIAMGTQAAAGKVAAKKAQAEYDAEYSRVYAEEMAAQGQAEKAAAGGTAAGGTVAVSRALTTITANPWPSRILWASLGLGGAALLLKLKGYRNGPSV